MQEVFLKEKDLDTTLVIASNITKGKKINIATCTAGICSFRIIDSVSQALPTIEDEIIRFAPIEKNELLDTRFISHKAISSSEAFAGIRDCGRYP
jgi:hypothetical protein